MLLPQASGEVSLGPARTSGDLELSIGASGEISGTLATTWGMEGEVASSGCFIAGVGRVGKSQGRGTCGIQIVSKTIQITKNCNVTKATGMILIKREGSLSRNLPTPRAN